MQYAIVILDGASGDPVPQFGGKTTLEASTTPNLDVLAQQGSVGLTQNVPVNMTSSSDVACLSIMGYDPAEYTLGRGAIEAAALGIDLLPDQVAFRLNLCYVEDDIMKGYSTGNISTEDGNALAEEIKAALDDEVFTLYPGTSFRQVLVVNGYPNLTRLTYETPHDNTGLNIKDASKPRVLDEVDAGPVQKVDQIASREAGQETGQVNSQAPDQVAKQRVDRVPDQSADQKAANMLVRYMQAADKVLAASPLNARRVAEGKWPANKVWVFWPGMKPDSLKAFHDIYGKSAAVNSAVDLLKGLALMTGMKYYHFEGVTDGPNNDFAVQGTGGMQMLEEGNDVVIIHVEAPDAAGHDGNPEEKKNGIEQSDKHILGPLLEYAQKHPLRIAVMSDHPTPLSTRTHSHEPVPFVLAGPGVEHNGAKRLTENEAELTGLMLEEGHKFIAIATRAV